MFIQLHIMQDSCIYSKPSFYFSHTKYGKR